jgi:hypothetical protein
MRRQDSVTVEPKNIDSANSCGICEARPCLAKPAGRSEVDRAVRPHYNPPARWPLEGLPRHAQVAQLVEHATENRSVGGSIPPLGTIGLSGPVLSPPRPFADQQELS